MGYAIKKNLRTTRHAHTEGRNAIYRHNMVGQLQSAQKPQAYSRRFMPDPEIFPKKTTMRTSPRRDATQRRESDG